MRRRAAFTLLETVLALAVAALATSLVLARLPDTRALGVESAAERLAGALSWARERAILSRRPQRLALDVAAGRWTVGRPGRAAGAVEAAPAPAPSGTLPAGVRVARLAGGAERRTGTVAVIDIGSEGDDLPAAIELADGGGRTARVVLPAGGGRARVERRGPPRNARGPES
jgi:Tfp pilus assembly protein FimT